MFIKIWFLFNQRFSKIILCWSKQVVNKSIISFLCSCIMINVYKAYVIDFQLKISSYDWIDFDFNSDIDWISKHSHSSDIKDSSMKIMSVTSVFIRVKNLNIFSKLLTYAKSYEFLDIAIVTLFSQIYYWIQTFLTFLNLQHFIEKSIEKSNW